MPVGVIFDSDRLFPASVLVTAARRPSSPQEVINLIHLPNRECQLHVSSVFRKCQDSSQ